MPKDEASSQKTTIYLPPELHRRVKIRAAQEGKSLNDLVIEGLEMRLGAKPGGGK